MPLFEYTNEKELASKVGLRPTDFYQHLLKDPTPGDLDFEMLYPDGDGFIPIDQPGSLLLLASTYNHNSADLKTLLGSIPSEERLTLHKRLVDAYLDEANFNMIDAIILLGLIMEKDLSPTDIPPFNLPLDPASEEFLEYLQVHPIPMMQLISENGCHCSNLCI
jgi:hypothetical protein